MVRSRKHRWSGASEILTKITNFGADLKGLKLPKFKGLDKFAVARKKTRNLDWTSGQAVERGWC